MGGAVGFEPVGYEEPPVLHWISGGLRGWEDAVREHTTLAEVEQEADLETGMVEISHDLAQVLAG
jgi:hypothetical protein